MSQYDPRQSASTAQSAFYSPGSLLEPISILFT